MKSGWLDTDNIYTYWLGKYGHSISLQAMKNEAGIRNIHLSLLGQQWGQLKMLVQYYWPLVGNVLIYCMLGVDWGDTRGLGSIDPLI